MSYTECFNPGMRRDRAEGTLVELVLTQAHTQGDRTAILDGTQAISYGELAESALCVSDVLRDLGVERGDRVAISGRNSIAWVCTAVGILCAGAIVVPIGYGVSESEYARIVRVTRPKMIITEFTCDRNSDGPTISEIVEAARHYTACRDHGLPDAGDTALILSTSGSTGMSKQVPMTHRQLTRLYSSVAARLGMTAMDRILGVVPLAHSFGFNGVLLTAITAGASVRLVESYDRGDLADLVIRDRVTVIMGPPTVLFDLIASGREDVGLVCRMAVSGGSDVPLGRMRKACQELGIVSMFVGYGLTEACGTVAIGSVTEGRSGSLAMLTPIEGLEVRIVDEYGYSVPSDVDGHVICSGYNVFTGYLEDPDTRLEHQEGREMMSPTEGDVADGWLRTGDIGWTDDEGHLYIVSRAKDTVIVSGFNVYPQEVELALLEHELVCEAIVIGVVDDRQGQRLIACIIPVAGRSVDVDELTAFCRKRLSAYKVPKAFVELEMIPTTHAGKPSREMLREKYSDRL
ncbi:AMP-binding protein [Rhodococcus sp. IEGM 1241]|uniref:class I adenylate-forming enzyme family protein n=2 Tax=Rhodococcus TaxID=1827 RepID=UPI0029542614|nr:AMP-binding protein [Rhodococcus sp. IEGM 1241]MDV8010644.1 AMP-binding protein [Rhodococcus sp. IEGM 1241]